MPTPTTPDPAPQPPAAALAVPCRRCGREDGTIRTDRHRPWRGQGYCVSCYTMLWNACDAGRYASLDAAHVAMPYTGKQGRPSPTDAAHVYALARAEARQAAIRDDAGPLITVALSTGRAAAPIPTGNAWGRACEPPWCPAPWHTALATLDEPTRAAA